MVSVMRAPKTMRAKMSRPSSSVPNQMRQLAGCKPVREVLQGGGLPIGDQRGEDRHQDQQQHDAEPGHRQRVAAEAEPGAEPAAAARLASRLAGAGAQQPGPRRARIERGRHH